MVQEQLRRGVFEVQAPSGFRGPLRWQETDETVANPQNQYGIESRLSWFAKLHSLPGDLTTEEDAPELAVQIAGSNHQHPDHDTAVWPPEEGKGQ